MKGKAFVKKIVLKDLYDEDVYVVIPCDKLRKIRDLIDDELKTLYPDDIYLDIKSLFEYEHRDGFFIEVDDIDDDMPF